MWFIPDTEDYSKVKDMVTVVFNYLYCHILGGYGIFI